MSMEGYCIYRKIGSTGLVIFERDGLLLRRRRPGSDLMLGDIDDGLVRLLKKLRELQVRFGFISDQSGMDAGSHGKLEFAVLTRVLDQLLSVRGALPDFWMARGESAPRRGAEFRYRNNQGQMSDVYMISQALKWYGVDRRNTISVCSSEAAILAASDVDVASIRYSDGDIGRTYSTDIDMDAGRCASLTVVTELSGLAEAIGQILSFD